MRTLDVPVAHAAASPGIQTAYGDGAAPAAAGVGAASPDPDPGADAPAAAAAAAAGTASVSSPPNALGMPDRTHSSVPHDARMTGSGGDAGGAGGAGAAGAGMSSRDLRASTHYYV